jgi:hypothetical protein
MHFYRWPERYAVLAFVLAVCIWAPVVAQDNRRDSFREMAHEIIAGLDRTRRADASGGKKDVLGDYMRKAYNYIRSKRLRIAVAPFDQDDIKISKAVADGFNESLYSALLKKAGGRYDFIARQKLEVLISDLQQTGAWEAADGNPINALMRSATNIDVLIEGSIHVTALTVVLTYTALGMDGRVLALTERQKLELSHDEAKITRTTMGLDRAIRTAAEYLSIQASNMEELLLGGIRFEDSGAQSEFGRYLQERLASAVENALGNAVTAKNIRVNPLRVYRGFDRGIDVTSKELITATPSARANAYVLRGTYWELPGSIELRVNLKGAKGASTTWIGWISADDSAGRRIRPTGDFGSLRDNDGRGPFAFHLTSDRGKDAAYRIGEQMSLVIRLDSDAWVYCFYRQVDGKTVQILPNPEFWKHNREPRLKGGVPHTIPGGALFPFEFQFVPPAGVELVKCFAVSRDVTEELPPELRGKSLDPLSRGVGLSLSSLFRRLPDAAVSEASFVVTLSK